MAKKNTLRIAIACQGGGSHTAFTAGAMKTILREIKNRPDLEIVALSGASGGAICALLAWYGLLKNDTDFSLKLIDTFWERNSALSLDQVWLNAWVVWGARMKSILPLPEISPYSFPSWGQSQLRSLLLELVKFVEIPALSGADTLPMLLVGATDVLTGEFKTFKNDEIGVSEILASTAVPSLFPAVETNKGVYWDGLFSENPPVSDLTDADPDQIWVIRINPKERAARPVVTDDIIDRRNELSGNLSLNKELNFIEKVNTWLNDGTMVSTKYKPIAIKEIEMKEDLDYASKLDRSPALIGRLMKLGEAQALDFF